MGTSLEIPGSYRRLAGGGVRLVWSCRSFVPITEQEGYVCPAGSSSWRSTNNFRGSYFPVARGAWRLALLLATLVCLVSAARAQLDSTQPISQYVHQVWEDDLGLPQNVRFLSGLPARDDRQSE